MEVFSYKLKDGKFISSESKFLYFHNGKCVYTLPSPAGFAEEGFIFKELSDNAGDFILKSLWDMELWGRYDTSHWFKFPIKKGFYCRVKSDGKKWDILEVKICDCDYDSEQRYIRGLFSKNLDKDLDLDITLEFDKMQKGLGTIKSIYRRLDLDKASSALEGFSQRLLDLKKEVDRLNNALPEEDKLKNQWIYDDMKAEWL